MTYAAQVRSVNKVVTNKISQNETCDVNSLRIICKYFVGSVVKIKTSNEELEGVLHTLYQNKVCLSLVTSSDSKFPQKIISMQPSKMINLSDILCVTASDVSKQQDVSIKGKLINLPSANTTKNNAPCVSSAVKSDTVVNDHDNKKETANGSSKLKYVNVLTKSQSINQNPQKSSESISTTPKEPTVYTDKPVESAVKNADKENNDQISISPVETSDTKFEDSESNKSESMKKLNPNAPEFKPRFFNTNYPPVLMPGDMNLSIFPPPTVQSPPIISPNTISSAVFIPNYILLNSQQLAAQQTQPSDIAAINSSDTSAVSTTNTEPIVTASSMTNVSPSSVMPMYSPISFFVPNTSIVQLSPQTNHSNTNSETVYSSHNPNRHNLHYPAFTGSHSKVAPRHMRMSESSSDDCNIQISHNVAYNMGSIKKRSHNAHSTASNDAKQNAPDIGDLSDWPPLPGPNGNALNKSPNGLE